MAQVALIDMDGTVADYDGGLRVYFEKMRSPYEPPLEHRPDGNPPWLEARRHIVSSLPGFWRGLKPLPVGFQIVTELQDHDFDLHVLTKGPASKSVAWGEKLEWCREHLPGVSVSVTERKDLTYGHVLVDDWPPYFSAWLAHRPRGVVIVPAHSWNEGCEALDPSRVFRYSGTPDYTNLRRVVEAVASRKNGEPIDLRTVVSR
jgi:hypothetical protein